MPCRTSVRPPRTRDRCTRGFALACAIAVAVALAALLPATAVHAATTYTVNATTDTGAGSGTSGDLRYAVTQANADPGSTIIFAPNTNGQTITVGSELDLTANVTITGNGVPNTKIVASYAFPASAFTVQSGTLTLSGVTVSGGFAAVNTLGSAGATVHDSYLYGSTFGLYATNTSSVRADRVLFQEGNAGAIASGNVSITVTNSTFNDQSYGVDSLASSSVISVAGSTFNGNAAAFYAGAGVTLHAANNILNGSTMYNCFSSGGTIIDDGHNLAYGRGTADTTCPATFTRDQNPLLAPLATNGATNGVQTYALQAGSPAIDAGTCQYIDIGGGTQTLTIDARGVPRPQGTACDIGSYESVTAPLALTVTRAADDVNDTNCRPAANGGCTLRQAVNLSNLATGSGTNTITFAPALNGQTITLLSGSGGTLTPTRDVTIDGTGRSVTISGGGSVQLLVVNRGVTLNLTALTLANGSSSGGNGGAINNTGIVNVTGSTFTDNSASAGGAIFNNGTVNVTNSTFTRNTSPLEGGGAIYNVGGGVRVTGSTFSGNSAFIGGAISNFSTLSLSLSVVAGNTAPNGSPDLSGAITSGGGNVIGKTDGSIGITDGTDNDRAGTIAAPLDPMIGGLALNAPGTTQTFALLPGSPAIDRAPCPTDPITNMTLATDQRGVTRPQGSACDAGAFESRRFTADTPTGDGQSTAISTQFGSAAGLTVSDPNGEPVTGGVVTFTIVPGTGGASATFAGGGTTATGTIGSGGGVSSPTFTANGTVGSFTITATAAGVLPATTTFTETNTAGPAASFTVTGFPSPVVAGTPGNVTVTAKDGFGNTATGYTGTVRITSSDPAAALPMNATLTNGVGTFSVTLKTVGSQSITATDTITNTITGAQTGIIVNGTAPLAVADGYSLITGTTLTVPAPSGLLANDTRGTPAATITAHTAPAHGTLTLNPDGSFAYVSTAPFVGNDAFTYTLSNGPGTFGTGSSTATVTLAVNAATVTSLTTVAPTGTGSGNSGTATTPVISAGGTLPLATTGTYSNGTTGSVSGLTYTSGNANVVVVDATGGMLTGIAGGTATITVSAPDGKGGTVITTITVTVTAGTGGGLVAPAPMARPGGMASTAGAGATPVAAPTRKPETLPAATGGAQPQAAEPLTTATAAVQPARR